MLLSGQVRKARNSRITEVTQRAMFWEEAHCRRAGQLSAPVTWSTVGNGKDERSRSELPSSSGKMSVPGTAELAGGG